MLHLLHVLPPLLAQRRVNGLVQVAKPYARYAFAVIFGVSSALSRGFVWDYLQPSEIGHISTFSSWPFVDVKNVIGRSKIVKAFSADTCTAMH